MSRPSKTILPAVGSTRRTTARPVVVLPQPDSPTRPTVSPRSHGQVDAVDRTHHVSEPKPPRDREVLGQPLDDQQRLGHDATSTGSPPAPSASATRYRVDSGRWQATAWPGRPVASRSGTSVCTGCPAPRRERAAGMERTAGRQVDQARRVAADRPQVGVRVVAQRRDADDSSPTVYGCCGARSTVRHRPGLDGPARVHDQHVVRDLADHAEIVGDQDDRRVELALQVGQQIQDLCLHRHVERGGRLVGDDQVRIVDQRHRDHRALPHAAGELVRILVDAPVRLRDADPVEHLDRPRAGPRPWTPGGGPGTPRRSAGRPCSTGAAPTAGPGRSSPCRGRAVSAAHASVMATTSRPPTRIWPVIVGALRIVQSEDCHAKRRSFRSRIRRRCRVSVHARPRTTHRRPP